MSLSTSAVDLEYSSEVAGTDDLSCPEELEGSSQKKEDGSGDGDSTSSSSSSPEVDQHLHQEKKKAAGDTPTSDEPNADNTNKVPPEPEPQAKQSVREAKAARTDKPLADKSTDARAGRKNTKATGRRAYHKVQSIYTLHYALIRDKYAVCDEYPKDLLPSTSSPHPDHKKWIDDLLRPSGGATRASTPSPNDGEKARSSEPDAPPAPPKSAGSRDARERLKQEEQDGIILSPQRRSFGTGCQLSGGGAGVGRPASPADPRGRDAPALTSVHHRQELPLHRRIGSGRIMRRDEAEPQALLEAPVSGRRGVAAAGDLDLPEPPRGRDPRDWRNKEPQLTHHHLRYDREERFDSRRRGFFEASETEKTLDLTPPQQPHRQGPQQQRSYSRNTQDNQRNPRGRVVYNNSSYTSSGSSGSNYHNYNRRQEEEETPEWFSEGPTSQNEYIELVGFDGPVTDDSKCEALRSRRESPPADPRPPSSKGASKSSSPVELG
ncbi:uncharacterized protein LOC108664692, partial [Hyalella azteca]|uniref:Uncharacterized protein LOC108664692 n=1 Tax=Hyalella azteca TaxID=294128 RepID=A0A979FJY9_HYAAZ